MRERHMENGKGMTRSVPVKRQAGGGPGGRTGGMPRAGVGVRIAAGVGVAEAAGRRRPARWGVRPAVSRRGSVSRSRDKSGACLAYSPLFRLFSTFTDKALLLFGGVPKQVPLSKNEKRWLRARGRVLRQWRTTCMQKKSSHRKEILYFGGHC